MAIRILIADDHQILRAGLKTLLHTDSNLVVVGEATSSDEALEQAQQLKPDIVLMDISMPGSDGLETTRQLIQTLPSTRVLMLTMHEDRTFLQEYLRAGVSGYIIKRAAESELIDAIYAVWRGMIYVHPSLMQALVAPDPKAAHKGQTDMDTLTLRELDILRYLVHGHTNRQIAEALNISVRTVETHRSNLMDKLNLHSRVDLVRYATDRGLVKLEEPI
ncbi:MAG TPA: response regulator transcription factor [Anaerolineaceae bacterium]|nr:response regulator transcription factor [Anaerolineaceae bacterium]